MIKLIKKEKTSNRILRFIGNISGSIFTYFLIKSIRSERKNRKLIAKMFDKICNLFHKPFDTWGTFYVDAKKNQ